jgi:hypothetical protein
MARVSRFQARAGNDAYSLNVPELIVQRILRHKPGSAVTRMHYIQTPTPDVLEAMEKFEQMVGSARIQ